MCGLRPGGSVLFPCVVGAWGVVARGVLGYCPSWLRFGGVGPWTGGHLSEGMGGVRPRGGGVDRGVVPGRT